MNLRREHQRHCYSLVVSGYRALLTGCACLCVSTLITTVAQAQQKKQTPQPAGKPLVDRAEYQAALRASSQRLFEVAALKYERLLADKSLSSEDAANLSVKLVDALIRAEKPQRALVALTLFKVPDSEFWKAQAFLQQRRFKEAELALKIYLETEGGRHKTLGKLALGQAIMAQGRESTGRGEFKDLMASPEPLVAEKAMLLWNESEVIIDRAPNVLKRLGAGRGNPELEFIKACAWLKLGDGKQAEVLLRRILEALPKPPKRLHDAATVRLADSYYTQGRLRTAERLMQQFLASPYDSDFFEQAFAVLEKARSPEENDTRVLLEQWSQAPFPEGRHALALYYLSQDEIEAGNYEQAMKLLQEFHQKYPNHERTATVLRTLMSLHGTLMNDEKVLELANEWRRRYGQGGDDTVDFLVGMVRYARKEYVEAAELFGKSSAVAGDVMQQQRAVYNKALALLMGGNEPAFQKCVAELIQLKTPATEEDTKDTEPLTQDPAAKLLLEKALHLAAKHDLSAEAALQEFIDKYPQDPRLVEARIALAEICLLSLPPRLRSAQTSLEAAAQLDNVSDEWLEKLDYTRLWLFEADENLPGVAEAGNAYLSQWTKSSRRDEVMMKLAQAYYRMEDFAKAEAIFEQLEQEQPNSSYAEVALFFAGKAAMNLLTTEGVEKALTLWAEVAARGGPLARQAQRQQAMAKRRQGKEEEALAVIENLLTEKTPASQPEPEEILSLLVEKGELLVLLSRLGPQYLDSAVEVFSKVHQEPGASLLWRIRAGVLLAQCYRQQEKNAQALETCYDVVDVCLQTEDGEPPQLNPQEFQWFYRAGFMALDLIEVNKQWEAAAKFADRLASAGGARTEEAKQRASRLRLEHFIWDK